MDAARRTVVVDGKSLKLRRAEYNVLSYLVHAAREPLDMLRS